MIRVVVATNSGLTGDAIRAVLDRERDVSVVACARTQAEVEFLLPQCNVLLVTPQLQRGNVLDLVEQARAAHPEVKILIVGAENEPEAIVTYLQAGAAGYVLGQESVHGLIKKVRAAHEDKALVSPDVAAQIMSRLVQLAQQPAHLRQAELRLRNLSQLTPREEEVLQLVGLGYTNKRIAAELVIGPGTVKNHVHNILKKLETSSRHEAADLYRLHVERTGGIESSKPLAA